MSAAYTYDADTLDLAPYDFAEPSCPVCDHTHRCDLCGEVVHVHFAATCERCRSAEERRWNDIRCERCCTRECGRQVDCEDCGYRPCVCECDGGEE